MTDTALVLYGTMRPGEANHWVVKNLGGQWLEGTIQAWKFDISWGAADGYPGIILDPAAPDCEVSILVAAKLPKHWHEIDRFASEGYRRAPVEVRLSAGPDGQDTVGDGASRPDANGSDDGDDDVVGPGSTILASIYEAIQDNPD